jgi:Flp pilus assembly protein TadG
MSGESTFRRLAHAVRARICMLHRDEGGSVAAELTLLTPLLMVLALFVVLCGRITDTKLRINDVAHQAARAATLARTPAQAATNARTTASAALASAGITCQSLTVSTNAQGLKPGSTVIVTVSCNVGLGDLTMLGVPGSQEFESSFSSPVDIWRNQHPRAGGRYRMSSTAPSPRLALRRLREDQSGWVTAFVVIIVAAALLFAGLVLDGGLALAAKVRALGEAQEAARAGAQEIDLTAYRVHGTLRLEPLRASSAARSYLAATGHTGTVSVSGNTVNVTVTINESTQLLMLFGIGSITVTGTGRAQPQRGISAVSREFANSEVVVGGN